MKTRLSDILTLPVLLGIGLCLSSLLIIAGSYIVSMSASLEPYDSGDTTTQTASIATLTPINTPRFSDADVLDRWSITTTEALSFNEFVVREQIAITVHGVYQARKNNEMEEMIDGLQAEIDSVKSDGKEEIEILVA